ncbi:hypothetical protein PCC7424_5436 (plasmid) [Gloeothece citriformis PCC 7424]|uniref:Uncharacterized protein n=1 Tax=Gloeothece citriformis (strain PCC 7424) TaxID=65393 RepID=B7KMI8_GLOC7|nr:hypothetical protein [Gloeothece citriformis]ACK74010.1 hypothetical protein PCC7424_5436 [Gloeothece citriformis PCC 7424]
MKKSETQLNNSSIDNNGLVPQKQQKRWILQALLISSVFIIPHGLAILAPNVFKTYWKPYYKVWDWQIGEKKPSH